MCEQIYNTYACVCLCGCMRTRVRERERERESSPIETDRVHLAYLERKGKKKFILIPFLRAGNPNKSIVTATKTI